MMRHNSLQVRGIALIRAHLILSQIRQTNPLTEKATPLRYNHICEPGVSVWWKVQ